MRHLASEYYRRLGEIAFSNAGPDSTTPSAAVQQSEPVNIEDIDEITLDEERSIGNSTATSGTAGLSSPSQQCISSPETVHQPDTNRDAPQMFFSTNKGTPVASVASVASSSTVGASGGTSPISSDEFYRVVVDEPINPRNEMARPAHPLASAKRSRQTTRKRQVSEESHVKLPKKPEDRKSRSEVEAQVDSTSSTSAGSVSPPDHLGRYVEIVVQPEEGRRFRYDTDIGSAGAITGKNERSPKIKIHNYIGKAKITVSCVCKDKPYRVHPNGLVGKKKKSKKFIYVKKVSVKREDFEISFDDIGIRMVKGNQIKEALQLRKAQGVDPFEQGFNHNVKRSELQEVRLCFQVKFPQGDKLEPVISDVITHWKKLGSLAIKDMDACCLDKKGGKNIYIFGKQLNPKNLEVYFYEIENEKKVWEQCVRRSEFQAHEHSCIVCKAPAYTRAGVEPNAEVTVNVVLRRVSDGLCGNVRLLTYRPEITDILKKKKRKTNDLTQQSVGEVLTPPATLCPDYAVQRNQDWRKIQGSLDDNPGLPATSIANAGVPVTSFPNAAVSASSITNAAVPTLSNANAAVPASSSACTAMPASSIANAGVKSNLLLRKFPSIERRQRRRARIELQQQSHASNDLRQRSRAIIDQRQSIAASIANAGMPSSSFAKAGVSASSFTDIALPATIFTNKGVSASSFANADVSSPIYLNTALPATISNNAGFSESSFANADVSSPIYLNTGVPSSSSTYAATSGPNQVNSGLPLPATFFTNAGFSPSRFDNADVSSPIYLNTALPATIFNNARFSASSFDNADVSSPIYLNTGVPASSSTYAAESGPNQVNSGLPLPATIFTNAGFSPSRFDNADVSSPIYLNTALPATIFNNAGFSASSFDNADVSSPIYLNTGVPAPSSTYAAESGPNQVNSGLPGPATIFTNAGFSPSSFANADMSSPIYLNTGVPASSSTYAAESGPNQVNSGLPGPATIFTNAGFSPSSFANADMSSPIYLNTGVPASSSTYAAVSGPNRGNSGLLGPATIFTNAGFSPSSFANADMSNPIYLNTGVPASSSTYAAASGPNQVNSGLLRPNHVNSAVPSPRVLNPIHTNIPMSPVMMDAVPSISQPMSVSEDEGFFSSSETFCAKDNIETII